jgi:hypothetical protein
MEVCVADSRELDIYKHLVRPGVLLYRDFLVNDSYGKESTAC